MPLLRRPARPHEQAAVAARVQSLLRPVRGGWVLPPDEEASAAGWQEGAGLTRAGSGAAAPRVLDASVVPADSLSARAAPVPSCTSAGAAGGSTPADPLPVEEGGLGPAVVPSVLARLRAGRLDPGRRAVAGLAVLGLLASLLAGGLLLRGRPQEVAAPLLERPGTPIAGASLPVAQPAGGQPVEAAEVVVAVAGRVRRPGLVRLPPGSRVDDAVRAAGGLLPGASAGLLNLARKVVDGEQVLVGVEAPAGAAPAASGGPVPPPVAGARVDLNRASAADLDALPGIGPVLAQRIVEHRTQHGPFRSVDQLREVSGIGEAKYASLRERVSV